MVLPAQPTLLVVAESTEARLLVWAVSLALAGLIVWRFVRGGPVSPVGFALGVGVVAVFNGGPLILAADELGVRINPNNGRLIHPVGLPMLAWLVGVLGILGITRRQQQDAAKLEIEKPQSAADV
jgi:hypothetical protein